QAPAPPAPPAQNPENNALLPSQQQPTRDVIRRNVDLITSDVIVRNDGGQFVADLGKNDFDVYEDGVKQDVVTFVLTHGGRTFNYIAAPAPAPMEGVLLPPARPHNHAGGRILLIFVD